MTTRSTALAASAAAATATIAEASTGLSSRAATLTITARLVRSACASWPPYLLGPVSRRASDRATGAAQVAIVCGIPEDGGMHPLDGPVLPIAPQDANRPALPLKLRDIPAAAARPAAPAEPRPGDLDPPTVVEPRGPAADEEVRAIPAPRERFGHYVVLHQIGEGAMGVVLAAYDQHLDRKVALKLLRADIDDSNEGVHHRMRREAQAMARLSHPNVVQVYEAGEVDGHLFLAMEFVQGVTLRAWMTQRPRPWHEVLPVLLQAGRGLAAAHAAGLTHRDFKPDNVMVGDDGRALVLDFGLSRGRGDWARSQIAITRKNLANIGVTAAGSMLGTPAYMSPEQFRGDEADARSDQFGFCATMWEGLYGQRPFQGADVRELRTHVLAGKLVPPPEGTKVPTWLRAILERGLSLAADNRWPSMQALLTALEYDPGRTRRRWAVAGLAGLAIAAAGFAGAAYRGAEARACDGAADALAGVWDEPQRTALEAAVRATSVDYAETTLATARGHLDGYRDGLIAAHTSACEAHRRGSVSDSLFDRRMLCLRQRRAELAATVSVLQQTTAETVAQVASTATGLPPLAACEDDERLLNDRSLPTDPAVAAAVEKAREGLARVQALGRSQRYQEALAELAPLQREAEALGDLTFHAEVLLRLGLLTGDTMHHAEALKPLEQAEVLALESGADTIAAQAISAWISNVGYGAGRPAEALAAGPRAWALVRRVGSPPDLVADLHNNMASARYEAGDAAGGSAEYEQALAALSQRPPDDLQRVPIVHNLVLAWNDTGRHEEARNLAASELARMITSHGACHPDTSALRLALAQCEAGDEQPELAVEHAEQSYACFVATAPQQALRTVALLIGLAFQRRDAAQVRRQLGRVDPLLARVGDDPAMRVAFDMYRARLALQDGHNADAARVLTALSAQLLESDGPKEFRAHVESMQSELALAERDPARAVAHANRAIQLLPPMAPPRTRGQVHFVQARALWAVDDKARAVAVAEEAIAAFEVAGPGFAGQVAEIRTWLANPPAP